MSLVPRDVILSGAASLLLLGNVIVTSKRDERAPPPFRFDLNSDIAKVIHLSLQEETLVSKHHSTVNSSILDHCNVHYGCTINDSKLANTYIASGSKIIRSYIDGWNSTMSGMMEGGIFRKGHITDEATIGKDVEIGRLVNIDKGSWRDTKIGQGTKIDSHVHISHNAIVGEHCLLVAGGSIGGSAEIGDYSYIGFNAVIKQHVTIGKHVIIGAGAIVINDVADYEIMAGNPAKSIKSKVKLTDKERFRMVGY